MFLSCIQTSNLETLCHIKSLARFPKPSKKVLPERYSEEQKSEEEKKKKQCLLFIANSIISKSDNFSLKINYILKHLQQ